MWWWCCCCESLLHHRCKLVHAGVSQVVMSCRCRRRQRCHILFASCCELCLPWRSTQNRLALHSTTLDSSHNRTVIFRRFSAAFYILDAADCISCNPTADLSWLWAAAELDSGFEVMKEYLKKMKRSRVRSVQVLSIYLSHSMADSKQLLVASKQGSKNHRLHHFPIYSL